jgi:hypothetical protein
MAEDTRTFEVPGKAFVAALSAASVLATSAGKLLEGSVLKSVRVEVEGATYTVVATDTYSLVAADVGVGEAVERGAWNLRLDAATLRVLAAAVKATSGPAIITIAGGYASIEVGGSKVTTTIDDSTYPRWRALFGPGAVALAEPISFSAERLGQVAAVAKASRQFLSARDRKGYDNVAATITSAQGPEKPITFEWPGTEGMAPSVRYLLIPMWNQTN